MTCTTLPHRGRSGWSQGFGISPRVLLPIKLLRHLRKTMKPLSPSYQLSEQIPNGWNAPPPLNPIKKEPNRDRVKNDNNRQKQLNFNRKLTYFLKVKIINLIVCGNFEKPTKDPLNCERPTKLWKTHETVKDHIERNCKCNFKLPSIQR